MLFLVSKIPEVGELMVASFVVNTNFEPKDWFVLLVLYPQSISLHFVAFTWHFSNGKLQVDGGEI
jgi:hypothetical protein